jgi:hypothetical protein
MSFCTACGAKAVPAGNFCSSCGASLNADTPISDQRFGMYERATLGVAPEVSAEFFVGIIADFCSRKWARWNEKVAFIEQTYGNTSPLMAGVEEPGLPSEEELDLLLADLATIHSYDKVRLVELHNFCVSALRAECLKDIKKAETIKVRSDLVLPRDWHVHYENLYQAQLPQLILAVVQHAFVGNPLDGELYEWSNRTSIFGGAKPGNKTKLAGAAAIGAAAAFLLGS